MPGGALAKSTLKVTSAVGGGEKAQGPKVKVYSTMVISKF